MASLGAGTISVVGSQSVNVTPQTLSVAGVTMSISGTVSNTKMTPIVNLVTGKVATVMKLSNNNQFKSR